MVIIDKAVYCPVDPDTLLRLMVKFIEIARPDHITNEVAERQLLIRVGDIKVCEVIQAADLIDVLHDKQW